MSALSRFKKSTVQPQGRRGRASSVADCGCALSLQRPQSTFEIYTLVVSKAKALSHGEAYICLPPVLVGRERPSQFAEVELKAIRYLSDDRLGTCYISR